MSFFQTLTAVYFFATFPSIAIQQNSTDFLGTWKFSEYKSDPNSNMPKQVKFDQKGDTLFINRLERTINLFRNRYN
jgi:hypothetical protein